MEILQINNVVNTLAEWLGWAVIIGVIIFIINKATRKKGSP
jgi:hypothetical protein